MNLISLFAGCGGLDLGFKQEGFHIKVANENNLLIASTYAMNHFESPIINDDIRNVKNDDFPNNIIGIIGGPPCQSWSEAGSQKGIEDPRGKLFYEYIRILKAKKPKFFLAENVKGMLFDKNSEALQNILVAFNDAGYDVFYKLLNASEYGVPQDRLRLIFIGFRKDLGIQYVFPETTGELCTLKDVIYDLKDSAICAKEKNMTNGRLSILNHEYFIGGFSSRYMSRNRVRGWDEQSFTIQASGRHAPIHPQANPMIKTGKDDYIFDPDSKYPYRRLTVRECARIQTFPDHFNFGYDKVDDGYKMIGNAVPPKFANVLAKSIRKHLL